MYFEIYGVSDALKPRFAALNFKGKPRFAALNFEGAAESWLQTLELRGRVKSWEALCQAFCDRVNMDFMFSNYSIKQFMDEYISAEGIYNFWREHIKNKWKNNI